MKNKTGIVGAVVVGIIVFAINLAGAQTPPPSDSAKAAEMAAMMEAMAKYGAPGEHHRYFEKAVGSWDATVTMWMEPGAPAETYTGTGTYSLILGDRYLKHDFEGVAMGQPFKGLGLTGYDNFRERYIDLWLDDMSTSMMISYGTMDSAGVVTYAGKVDDPMAGRKDVPIRSVTQFLDDNTSKMEMYVTDESGDEFKSMEIIYKRRK